MLMITLYAGLLDFLQTKTTVFFCGTTLNHWLYLLLFKFPNIKKKHSSTFVKIVCAKHLNGRK